MEGTSRKAANNNKNSGESEDQICRNVLSSFVTGNTGQGAFGTLSVPTQFHNEFGEHMPVNVILVCKEGFRWKAQYDKEAKAIVGVEEFMKIHEVKQQYIVLFNYVGNKEFRVNIYNTYGMEVDYRAVKPFKCKTARGYIFKDSEYIVGVDTLEEEKAKSAIRFTGFRESVAFFERKISNNDIGRAKEALILASEMIALNEHWKNGDKVVLQLLETTWEIDIEQRGDLRYFGNGWAKFAREIGLQVDDILICYKFINNTNIYVCLIKEDEFIQQKEISELIVSGAKNWMTSFLHLSTEDSIDIGFVGMPLLFENMFYKLVLERHTVKCGGSDWEYLYVKNNRKIDVFNLMDALKISPLYTIVFNCGKNVTSSIRIFRKDGMEIIYSGHESVEDIYSNAWYMDRNQTLFYETGEVEETDTDTSTEYGMIIHHEDVDNWTFQFSETLISCHVDYHTHGVYIPLEFEQHLRNWTNDTRVLFQTDRGTWEIGINLTNGRKRFSAGWNKFVRENTLNLGDTLKFYFDENESLFVIDIIRN